MKKVALEEYFALKFFTSVEFSSFAKELEDNLTLMDLAGVASLCGSSDPSLPKIPFRYEGTVYTDYNYILVPFYDNGTLLDLVTKCYSLRYTMSTNLKLRLCRNLIQAVSELHSHNKAHLDLKPENVVIDDWL